MTRMYQKRGLIMKNAFSAANVRKFVRKKQLNTLRLTRKIVSAVVNVIKFVIRARFLFTRKRKIWRKFCRLLWSLVLTVLNFMQWGLMRRKLRKSGVILIQFIPAC